MTRGHSAWLCSVVAIMALATPAAGQVSLKRRPYGNQIVERCGEALGFALGTPVSKYPDRGLTPVAAEGRGRQYRATDGSILRTDARGTVVEVTVQTAGAFTQRYAVVRQSTLGDVLQRYGTPTSSRQVGSELVLDYAQEGVAFRFSNPAGRALSSAQLSQRIQRVTVHQKAPDSSGRVVPCRGRSRH